MGRFVCIDCIERYDRRVDCLQVVIGIGEGVRCDLCNRVIYPERMRVILDSDYFRLVDCREFEDRRYKVSNRFEGRELWVADYLMNCCLSEKTISSMLHDAYIAGERGMERWKD